jgi:hypothetical protein
VSPAPTRTAVAPTRKAAPSLPATSFVAGRASPAMALDSTPMVGMREGGDVQQTTKAVTNSSAELALQNTAVARDPSTQTAALVVMVDSLDVRSFVVVLCNPGLFS